MTRLVHGRLDADDRLVDTDRALMELNRQAGAEGDRLVLPAVLRVARLARELGAAVTRPVLLGGVDGNVHAWLRARPSDDAGVHLALADWSERPAEARRQPAEEVVAPTPPPLLGPDFAEPLRRALDGSVRRIVAEAETIRASPEEFAPTYREYARDIAQAGRHLQALLDDLVTLNGVEEERPASERIDLADVARRAADLLSVRADQAEVLVSVVADPDAVAVGDFRRALQITVNLLANAIAHSPAGRTVTLHASLGGVSVRDRGAGVAPDDRERVFHRFVRIDPGDRPGSGLGLYISRRLARAMGGDLAVDDAPGGGALFSLSLPAD